MHRAMVSCVHHACFHDEFMTSTPCARPNNGGYNEKERVCGTNKDSNWRNDHEESSMDRKSSVACYAPVESADADNRPANQSHKNDIHEDPQNQHCVVQEPDCHQHPTGERQQSHAKREPTEHAAPQLWLFAPSQKLRPGKRLPATRGLSSGFFACLKPVGTCTKQFCFLRVLSLCVENVIPTAYLVFDRRPCAATRPPPQPPSLSRSLVRAEHRPLKRTRSCALSLPALANTEDRVSVTLREARFMKGDVITFFRDGVMKLPTLDPGTSEPSLSISSSTSSDPAGGEGKAPAHRERDHAGDHGFHSRNTCLDFIDLNLQSCFARHGFLTHLGMLYKLDLQIAAAIPIVLNLPRNRAPFGGLVGQLYRKRCLLFMRSGLKKRTSTSGSLPDS